MPKHETQSQAFIAEEVKKVKGIAVPTHAGKFERALVRKVKCSKLHPNPNDEFCSPEIGPNERIVSEYSKAYRLLREDSDAAHFLDSNIKEPLTVQKIRPDGYMILNGHHRWLAAELSGIDRIPVRIVNLTLESDVRKMLEYSKNSKRITLDLEEIVFADPGETLTEKPLPFPFNRIYRERLRLGIPALFSWCLSAGYDVWLYSSGYESVDYIRDMMRLYHAPVTGIITGTARKVPKDFKIRERLEETMRSWYPVTINADRKAVLRVNSRTKEYRDYPLQGTGTWSAEVIEILGKIQKEEGQLSSEKMRVSFDLDEVLFVSPDTHKTEPPLSFPMNKIYQERLRLGTPDVIRTLQRMGYEVWVYTSSFRSEKYIKNLFRCYGVRFDGIVNGNRHLKEVQRDNKTILPQKLPNRYRISLHVDDESVICSLGPQYGFKTYQLDAQDDEWKEKIITRAEEVRKLNAAKEAEHGNK